MRFLLGVTKKALPLERVERVQINGLPGFVVWTSEGPETLSLHIENDRIVSLYGIRNPDKLRHLS